MTPQENMRKVLADKASKPPAFHHSLNQPPRSMKQHGKHRKPNPPAHGDPVDRAGIRPGWAMWPSVTWAASPRAEPEAIPYAGIRTGELIGHRYWWIAPDNFLCSLAHYYLWRPGETIVGDINEVVSGYYIPLYGGVYAFSGPDIPSFRWEAMALLIELADPYGASYRFDKISPAGFVSGTVKMWGEVVEHETGYRAQFAKIHSIDKVYGKGDLDAIRAKYLPIRE